MIELEQLINEGSSLIGFASDSLSARPSGWYLAVAGRAGSYHGICKEYPEDRKTDRTFLCGPSHALGIRSRSYQGTEKPDDGNIRRRLVPRFKLLHRSIFGLLNANLGDLIIDEFYLVNKSPCAVSPASLLLLQVHTFACFAAPQLPPCQVLMYVIKSLFHLSFCLYRTSHKFVWYV